jgi:hypothetical protein
MIVNDSAAHGAMAPGRRDMKTDMNENSPD